MPPSSPFHALTDADALAAWLGRSHREPVLLFKHSLTCGTSAAAYEELAEYLAGSPGAPPCGMIVVQAHRSLSHEVAATLAVAHHSPQAFLVVDGTARWHASHWRITAAAVAGAVAAVGVGAA
jgi:bacillithiol system protein YtxJ